MYLETFYRVLMPDHTRTNWARGDFTGYNDVQHPLWEGIYNSTNSLDWRVYPLESDRALFHWKARMSYIESIKTHNGLDGWGEDEKRLARQIAGISAFRCPGAASQYAAHSNDMVTIATFRGLFVWPLAESEDTGVQAIVIQVVGDPVTPPAFRDAHGLKTPAPDENAGVGVDDEVDWDEEAEMPDIRGAGTEP